LAQSTPWSGAAFIIGLALVLAVITVVVWPSLIGLAPSAYAHSAARTKSSRAVNLGGNFVETPKLKGSNRYDH
jgi:hypothetical protein